ncbi:hypothetical protein C464_13455 [Halorubrum coriense DSM 10284]|uniref:Uncharacterized protein n=1 Tax=Halorubrum coriense DSM 10284 TaxID=1227466 RepID=M0E9Q5_9EURY|nr:hypothetical protein [Halorubrum coriense]ELZ44506.1 hypothetical protein C464_13455 [Halorubrum coriense DSM 10284]
MIGTTLLDIADHIESLATADGEFSLVCARYGDRPVPAAGLRFDSRETARAAARATEQYRDALRRYDPELPFYDVVVRQEFADPPPRSTDRDTGSPLFVPAASDSPPDELTERVVDDAARRSRGVGDAERTDVVESGGRSGRGRRRDRVEFCHATAAATFEALSAAGHDRAEAAVMDAYFSHAERIADPDRLCLCLLEAMAAALDRHLDPATQAAVLSDAADRLPAPREAPAADPVTAAFDCLAAVGLADGYERADEAEAESDPGGSAAGDAAVRVRGYALSPTDGRVPTLPVALELCRRDPRGRIAGVALLPDGGDPGGPDWRFRIVADAPAADGGPASAPIPSER